MIIVDAPYNNNSHMYGIFLTSYLHVELFVILLYGNR